MSCMSMINQQAEALVTQTQVVEQVNISIQSMAVAIAVGEDSFARAVQSIYQRNENIQEANISAINIDSTPCDEGFDNVVSNLIQIQNVSQANIASQDTVVAISIDGGGAEAIQSSAQSNINAQIGTANAVNKNECELSLNIEANNDEKKNDLETRVLNSQTLKTHAKPEKEFKIIVDIAKGAQKFFVKVHENGDILLNDQPISALRNKEGDKDE